MLRIVMSLLPSVAEPPEDSRWGVPVFARTVVSAMCVSRAWLDCLMHAGELWGALLPLARTERDWNRLRDLSLHSPKRLVYTAREGHAALDELLESASAVYAGSECPWEHFGLKLEGRRMPFLQALLIRPDERGMPRAALASPQRTLQAPRAVTCAISSPLVVEAERLEELVLSNSSRPQIAAALRPHRYLTRLEIHRTRSRGPIDWTDLLLSTSFSLLEELVFWCGAMQSALLSPTCVAVETPALLTLDAGGAVLLRGPCAHRVHFESVRRPDFVRMMKELPRVAFLSVTSLLPSGAEWPIGESNPGAETGAVNLAFLETFSLRWALDSEGLALLQSVNAPELYKLDMAFDASAPPNRAALEEVIEFLTVAVESGGAGLASAFGWARRAFEKSGYPQLLETLNDVLPADIQDVLNGEAVPVDADMREAMRISALALRESVIAAAAPDAEVLHAGHFLRRAVAAAATTMGINWANFEAVLSVALDAGEEFVAYEAVADNDEADVRTLTLAMSGTPLTRVVRPQTWERQESPAYCAARTLFGLAGFRFVEIFVCERDWDPFRALAEAQGVDIDELSASLAKFSSLDTLRFMLGERAHSGGLLKAVSGDMLASLTHIYVTSEAMGGFVVGGMHPPQREEWFGILEAALNGRAKHGHCLQYLDIRGYFCLCRVWLRRVSGLVDTLVHDVACARRVQTVCIVGNIGPFW